jgi:hypothetical protein
VLFDLNIERGLGTMKENRNSIILEIIEQRIEMIDPGTVVCLKDIAGKDKNAEVEATTIMLLNKYGIEYKKE